MTTDTGTLSQVASAVAEVVLRDYDSLPKNGKPLQSQFTCLSGIVACVGHPLSSPDRESSGSDSGSSSSGSLFSICLATGTKCLGSNAPLAFPGCTLADSHAEVLCRRAFNRYLLESIQQVLADPAYTLNPRCPIERVKGKASGEGSFRVKSNWEFWMYISDSPCGDASIYERIESGASYTGQKTFQVSSLTRDDTETRPPAPFTSIPSASSTSASVSSISQTSSVNTTEPSISIDKPSLSPHEQQCPQLLSLLRTKPGRKDIQTHLRSSSMSCSDKLARWMCLGTQGALLAYLLASAVHLSGLVVSADTGACKGSQLNALQRALSNRVSLAFALDTSCVEAEKSVVETALQPVLPFLAVIPIVFRQGKSFSENCHQRSLQVPTTANKSTVDHANTKKDSDNCVQVAQSGSSSSNTAGMSKRQQKKAAAAASSYAKFKPAGNNLNWILKVPTLFADTSFSGGSNVSAEGVQTLCSDVNKTGTVEVTLSSTGILQGCTVTTVVAAKKEAYATMISEVNNNKSNGNNNNKHNSSNNNNNKRNYNFSAEADTNTNSMSKKTKNTHNCKQQLLATGEHTVSMSVAAAVATGVTAERSEKPLAGENNTALTVPARPCFQSRLCQRELGYLFYQIKRKLTTVEDIDTAMTKSSENDSDSQGSNWRDLNTEVLYDHNNYHVLKKCSDAYCLKRELFLQNLAFRDWLTENK